MITPLLNIKFENNKQIFDYKQNLKSRMSLNNTQNDSFVKSNQVAFGNYYQNIFKSSNNQMIKRFVAMNEDDDILLSMISSELKSKLQHIGKMEKELVRMSQHPEKISLGSNQNVFRKVDNKLKPYYDWNENYTTFLNLCAITKNLGCFEPRKMKSYYKQLYTKPEEINKLEPLAAFNNRIRITLKKEHYKTETFVDVDTIREEINEINQFKKIIPLEEAKAFLIELKSISNKKISNKDFEKLSEKSSNLIQKINLHLKSKEQIHNKAFTYEMPFDIDEITKKYNEYYEHNASIINKYANHLSEYYNSIVRELPHGRSKNLTTLLAKQEKVNDDLFMSVQNYL